MDQKKFHPTWHMTNFLHSDLKIPLEPNDYRAFQQMGEGLYVDYNTVGKDLLDCFRTNDVKLVRKKTRASTASRRGRIFFEF